FYCSFGLPVTTIRPFNTFGPRQSARAIIPTIISQALTRESIKLGLLTPVRDFTFVLDTVAAFLSIAASEYSIGQVYNVGSGRGVTIGELADMILKMVGATKSLLTDQERLRPAQSEVMALICDHTRAHKILGWQPRYSLEQGLQCTIEYLQSH